MRKYFLSLIMALGATMMSNLAFAHCDSMNGPVVKAAEQALATGNVNYVLIWVPAKAEKEVTQAFDKALADHKKGVKDSEQQFFTKLVSIHRKGEGEPFTGLKAASIPLPEEIVAAEKDIADGKVAATQELLTTTLDKGLEDRLNVLLAKKNYKVDDVAAGREYVKAYTAFLHYVKHLHDVAAGTMPQHKHKK